MEQNDEDVGYVLKRCKVRPKPSAKLHKGGDTEISPTQDFRRSSSSVVPETEPKIEPKTEPEAESETPCVVPVAETKTEPKIEPEAESETPCQRSLLSVSWRSQMRYLCQSMKK